MIVVVEFPSLERAREWYRSSEYAHALGVRDKALSRNLILVDGMNDSTQIVARSERRRSGD